MTNAQNDTNSASRIPHLKETHGKHLAPKSHQIGSDNSQKETQEAYGKPNYPAQDYQSPKSKGTNDQTHDFHYQNRTQPIQSRLSITHPTEIYHICLPHTKLISAN